MTAQVCDRILFKGDEYFLIGIDGGDLASPEQFGMEPVALSTGCCRGFYATYELTEDALYLRELAIEGVRDDFLPIGGIEPVGEDYEATYQGLSVVVPFTGRIRLAKDFIDELYIHMGYQKPTAFKTVLDITLKGGRIVEIKDRSQDMEEKRGAFMKRYKKLCESGNGIQAIREAFSLDMDLE